MRLIILGAGQHGHVAQEVALSMGCFESVDFLDDVAQCAIGKLSDYQKYISENVQFFVAFGNNEFRLKWLEELKGKCGVATLISRMAMISPSARIGAGTIVEAGVVINSSSEISEGCILSIGSLIDHDTYIGKGCHIESGAVVMPNQKVSNYMTVAENTVYRV